MCVHAPVASLRAPPPSGVDSHDLISIPLVLLGLRDVDGQDAVSEARVDLVAVGPAREGYVVWSLRRQDGPLMAYGAARRQVVLAERMTATICPDCWERVALEGTPYPGRGRAPEA